jgi:EpsI family protein
MNHWRPWAPAALLGLGALFTVGIRTQRDMPLRAALESVLPVEFAGFVGRTLTLSEAEQRIAGTTAYLMRAYESPGAPETDWFTIYVGYYERQTQGRTIHSPKNCLPGSGWEALASRPEEIATTRGTVQVNHYLLQNGTQQALVLYWYQGRGRVEANEYVVKWDLLRDAALRQRSEEALVRVVVPIHRERDALTLARQVAAGLVPAVFGALPEG